ncbi:MAG: spermidine/putrescine ABC transporter substrate-binding protein [Cyanobacteria bacterium SZAS-4]|nr:spermidine/putrescine ABC transporter substrate-binding protein [Cyanobacteria bacterium SZAS-4]
MLRLQLGNILNRRDFLRLSLGTVFGASLTSCTEKPKSSQKNQLNIYSWADYLHPDTIPEFERRYGIHVVYDTFASNEALLAKLQAGATAYDIIVPTSYMIKQLRKLNKLSVLDHDRLSNFKNIMPRFVNPKFDPHLEHSIPYTWGTTGIAFNTAAVEKFDWPTNTDIFWNKKYAHRMTLLDDARETIGMSLKKSGHSFNTVDEPTISQAVADLVVQKPLTMCYTSDQVIVQLASGDSWLSLVYSGDAYQAQRENKDVKYVIPENGTSIWLDNLCIPTSAPHVENAYKWINFMLEPKVAAATASYTRYATPNQLAFELLPKDVTQDRNLYPAAKVMAQCEELGDIGSGIFIYDRMWTELKCS